MRQTRTPVYAVAALSLAAAVAHLFVMPEHFEEWWGYGTFFMVAATAQAAFAVLVLRRPSMRLFAAGAAGNLAIVTLYVITRTVGIPFLGPGAGEVEAVGAIDVVSKSMELVLVVVLALLIRSWPASVEGALRVERGNRRPRLLHVGFAVLGGGGLIDVVYHSLPASLLGPTLGSHAVGYAGHLITFAGMVLCLIALVQQGTHRAGSGKTSLSRPIVRGAGSRHGIGTTGGDRQ